jgi:hypothetical protein
MTLQVLKVVAIGILLGTAAFFMPMVLLAIVVFFVIFELLFRWRLGYECCCSQITAYGHSCEMADKIRSMSQEEYETFKLKMGKECCQYDSYSIFDDKSNGSVKKNN